MAVTLKAGVLNMTSYFLLILLEFKSMLIITRRPNLLAKLGTIYCRALLDDEKLAPDDTDDVLKFVPSKDDYPCLIHRYNSSYSSLYLELINTFASSNGFDFLATAVKMSPSIENILTCLELVAAPYRLYHRLYVIKKITPFVQDVIARILSAPKENLRAVKRQNLDDALLHAEELMLRVYTTKTRCEHFITLRTKVSISLLGAEQLEKRIQAIKLIAEVCKSAKASQEGVIHGNLPVANDSAVLSSLLQVPQLIEEIFGKRSHIELIQRSTEILKFILSDSKITKEDFNVIWNCCICDEQSKVEIFKVISDSYNLLPIELIGFIIDKFVSLSRTALKDQDMEVVCRLSCTELSPETMRKILDLMWSVIRGGSSNLSIEIMDRVMQRFCNAVTTTSRVPKEVMDEFFEKCYTMIEQGDNSIFAMRILKKSLLYIPVVGISTSRDELLFSLLNERKLFKIFFMDFERYFKKVKMRKEVKVQQHKEEVTERKEFLLFLMHHAKYKLTKEDLLILWTNLVKESAMPEDQVVFYNFLKQAILLKLSDHFSSIDDLNSFFTSVMCDESNDFRKLPIEGMIVMECLLFVTNKHMGKISELENVKKRQQDNYRMHMYNCDNYIIADDLNFCVKTLPSQIVGASILWKMVLEAENEAVSTKAIELIKKIHTKLSKELEEQIGDISANFVGVAMEKLRMCYVNMISNQVSRYGEIVKILKLIEGMLNDSERKGNGGITSLRNSIKGRELVLKIQNSTTNITMNPNAIKKFDLAVHSKVSFWQLLMLIAKKLQLFPEMLRIVFIDNNTKNENSNSSLEVLGLRPGDTIRVKKRNEEYVIRASLIKNKALTEKAFEVFKEIYDKFSEDGKMTMQNYTNFARICLANIAINMDYQQIIKIYRDYDKGSKGYLTFEEFIKFYLDASLDKEDIVWSNLKELGYGPDLNKLDSAKVIITSNSIAPNKLPRYLLSNNPDYLSFLFSLASIVSL